MARSAGGWLRSLSTSANPRPSGIPLPWEEGRWVTHPTSPSFLWKEVARSAGGWLCSHFAFGQPPALRASPFHGKGIDGLLIPLLPPSFGRRWRVASEVGFALFRLRPTPCPSGVPLPGEGDRWVTHPASPSFLWKEMARSVGSWLRSLFAFGQPPALRASPFQGKRVDSFHRFSLLPLEGGGA